jgi:hypothetical protein
MTDARTKEADLAALAARVELNCTLATTHFGYDPVVMAAVANFRANHNAFLAAVAEAEVARFFKRFSADKHVRQCSVATDHAFYVLKSAMEQAEDRANALR